MTIEQHIPQLAMRKKLRKAVATHSANPSIDFVDIPGFTSVALFHHFTSQNNYYRALAYSTKHYVEISFKMLIKHDALAQVMFDEALDKLAQILARVDATDDIDTLPASIRKHIKQKGLR